jgi:hypothetical protein
MDNVAVPPSLYTTCAHSSSCDGGEEHPSARTSTRNMTSHAIEGAVAALACVTLEVATEHEGKENTLGTRDDYTDEDSDEGRVGESEELTVRQYLRQIRHANPRNAIVGEHYMIGLGTVALQGMKLKAEAWKKYVADLSLISEVGKADAETSQGGTGIESDELVAIAVSVMRLKATKIQISKTGLKRVGLERRGLVHPTTQAEVSQDPEPLPELFREIRASSTELGQGNVRTPAEGAKVETLLQVVLKEDYPDHPRPVRRETLKRRCRLFELLSRKSKETQ